jgi:putative ABC transport system ATP-binding protein
MDFPDSGSLEVGGHELKRLDDAEAARYRRERVGFVFQFFNLVPTLTALDNVALPARLKGLSVTDARARAARLLEEVGLDQRSHDFPDTFSGGQQQRVAIARALVNEPELLLADEPTGALDRGTGEEIMSLLLELVQGNGTTLIVATHDEAVVDVAARVIHIEDGRVMRDERPGASRL